MNLESSICIFMCIYITIIKKTSHQFQFEKVWGETAEVWGGRGRSRSRNNVNIVLVYNSQNKN